jgi:hypothetical protein
MRSPHSSPPVCGVDSCHRPATIVHRDRPLCGKHALEKVEAGDLPETPDDFARQNVTRCHDAGSAQRVVSTVHELNE